MSPKLNPTSGIARKMTSLFKELRFYLAPKLSDADKADLEKAIVQNGGVISDTPADATQLVDYDTLDVRHPERIATDFIKESVASRALQDPEKYSGKIFTLHQEKRRGKRRGRIPYSLEDDARMLHFAKSRDWKSMSSIPVSVWKLAESERVTLHPALSMHEHFRKQLQRKTPIEQRIIMSKAAAMIRARLLEQEAEGEEERQEMLSSTGFRDAATPESTTSTQSRGSQRTPISASRQIATTSEPNTIESGLKEIEEEKYSDRIRHNQPAPSQDTPTQLTPATPRDQSTGHKRKRSSVAAASQESRQDTGESDVENKRGGEYGIYFRCAWTELVQDQQKRRMLQRFFEPSPAPAPQQRASSTDSVVSDQDTATVVFEDGNSSENGSEPLQTSAVQIEFATDEITDHLIVQLQIDTQTNVPSVMHALYCCSGDVDLARAFLKGASVPDLWSPEDDLLLVTLVAQENIDRSEVAAAVARGDFDSMQVARDAGAIWKRVQFLR
ncbi:hypothetical protein F441_09590 [Phytophthora nicotianae CJ01A1]|uniref:BRCT domain-containing protein n=4 Tax=Phytophthora nicotianae TaxID=4792 RepID=V9F6C2_PHYNI|nr:hypothetical protein F443_09663 [Phytophthora nicotianae P1569]ETK85832.1 hypothetical protein L915_09457 [Phytophthora nicotianae]ETP15708.1 hypothetical protein F441_09590 [Phytophthora nicotianae CJ01A1]ETP43742.1 hypothetical protein F442_09568 [Phytophthora nicotianae P10297]